MAFISSLSGKKVGKKLQNERKKKPVVTISSHRALPTTNFAGIRTSFKMQFL